MPVWHYCAMISSVGSRTAVVLAAIAVGQAVLVASVAPRILVPVTQSDPHPAVAWRVLSRGTTTGEPPEPDAY